MAAKIGEVVIGWLRRRAWVVRLARKVHLLEVDRVLLGAYQAGRIDSRLLHELDHRLKYEPTRPWVRGAP